MANSSLTSTRKSDFPWSSNGTRLPDFINVIKKESTGSTNEDMALLAKQGIAPWTVVQALVQTSGRGRHGKSWDSQIGNLFMSLLLRPNVNRMRWGELSLLSAIAVASTLSDYVDSQIIEVKWPNDVLINGKKIAGILLEVADFNVEEPSVIVGVGVNISKTPEKFEYPVTCINDYKTGHTSVDSVFISLLNHFVYWFHIWEDNGFGAIKDEWMRRAFKLGGSVSVENTNGFKAEYKFRGIDMEGAILLDDENGKRSRVRSGTVRFL
tara:strand:- start:1032 stop:1832 length:801 start_codon:yes stop_codon:yes gene_type:complete